MSGLRRICRQTVTLYLVFATAPVLAVAANGQTRHGRQGWAFGLHGIHIQPSYGEGVSSAGGIGAEVAYAPRPFVAPYVAVSFISAGLGSGGWRTLETGAQARVLIGRMFLLHAALGVGLRASADFEEYGFAAVGGGLDVLLSRRLALHGRIDVTAPFGDAPGFRRDRLGFSVFLGP